VSARAVARSQRSVAESRMRTTTSVSLRVIRSNHTPGGSREEASALSDPGRSSGQVGIDTAHQLAPRSSDGHMGNHQVGRSESVSRDPPPFPRQCSPAKLGRPCRSRHSARARSSHDLELARGAYGVARGQPPLAGSAMNSSRNRPMARTAVTRPALHRPPARGTTRWERPVRNQTQTAIHRTTGAPAP
jgi:hypothetical protein